MRFKNHILIIMRTTTSILFLLACSWTISIAQGISFYQGTWEEALEQAKQEEKLLFVDAYTTWCGPCKKMSSTVFPQQEVGDYYNENFISIKLDMEKENGMRFGLKYPVSAYPTMFYIAGDGEVVHVVAVAREADRAADLAGHLPVRRGVLVVRHPSRIIRADGVRAVTVKLVERDQVRAGIGEEK